MTDPANSEKRPLPVHAASRPQRDEHGRFLTGTSGGGRPRGSRNKLTETLISTIADDFGEHGADAIARVRTDDPAMCLRIVSALVPRDLILKREQQPDVDYSELTDDECNELLQAKAEGG